VTTTTPSTRTVHDRTSAVHSLALCSILKEAPMKLTVFGATGRTGLQVVEQGLAARHEMRAVVRDASFATPRGWPLTEPASKWSPPMSWIQPRSSRR
jgi:NmrA-like family